MVARCCALGCNVSATRDLSSARASTLNKMNSPTLSPVRTPFTCYIVAYSGDRGFLPPPASFHVDRKEAGGGRNEDIRLRVSAVVLAAGIGSRMRQVKPLVTVGGKPLLDHVLATARKAGLTDIVVVLGAAADQIRAAVVLNDCKVILNDSFEQGIGTSVSQGLANV